MSRSTGIGATTERVIAVVLGSCAGISILITLGIVGMLLWEAVPFFVRDAGIFEFLTGREWQPIANPPQLGVLPLLYGTLSVSLIALIIAVPVGLATAVFLTEYAPGWLRQTLKPILEIIAGIPSVVFGYFALAFVSPYLVRPFGDQIPAQNALSGGIVLAIMVLPTIVSLADDALRAVPRGLREGAYALAATRFEVALRVVMPAAMSGIVAAVLLAFARAIGETMAVTIAAGNAPNLTMNLASSVQTMTAYIVQAAKGETDPSQPGYRALYAVGLTLFVLTLGINLIAQRVLARYKETYE